MNNTEAEIMELISNGAEYDIATSNYSIDPIESTGWNPIAKTSHQLLKSMEKRGLIEAKFFFRGATIKKI